MDFLSIVYNYKHDWWRFLLVIGLSLAMSIIIAAIVYILALLLFGISGNIDFFQQVINSTDVCPIPFVNAIMVFSVYCFLLLSFICLFKWLHKGKWNWLINSFSKFRWNRIGAAIVLDLLFSLVSLPFFFGELEEMEATFAFNAAEFFPYFLVLLLMLPIQVSTEEVIFRSYVGQMFALIFKRPIVIVVLTSIIFALIHYGDLQQTESYAVLFTAIGISGLTYAIIMILDNGIEICIGLHFISNLMTLVMYKREGLSGLFEISHEYQVGWFAVLTELVYSIIVLLAFTKLYHWDWRKLFQKIERPAVIDNGTMNCD